MKEKQKYTYIYDFGDDWMHKITLEKITEEVHKNADCIDGEGACPPEDCGGPWGYAELKEKLSDAKHSEYTEIREWMGLDEDETWDATAFDLATAQQMIKS